MLPGTAGRKRQKMSNSLVNFYDERGNQIEWEGEGWYVNLPLPEEPGLYLCQCIDKRPGLPPGQWHRYFEVLWLEDTDGYPLTRNPVPAKPSTKYYYDERGNILAWDGPGWYVEDSYPGEGRGIRGCIDPRPGAPPEDGAVWLEDTDGYPLTRDPLPHPV
jgi:hypothetical protein